MDDFLTEAFIDSVFQATNRERNERGERPLSREEFNANGGDRFRGLMKDNNERLANRRQIFYGDKNDTEILAGITGGHESACPQCGEPMVMSANFCPDCGANL